MYVVNGWCAGPPRAATSPVWSFFDYIPESNQSVCKVDTDNGPCGARLKGKKSTTLKGHVKSFHPEVYGLCNVIVNGPSPVWEYFEYLSDSDVSICKVDSVDGRQCGTVVKGKETAYLRGHLKSHHEQVYNQHWDVRSTNIGLRRSPVWEYFEYLPDSNVSICKVDSVDGRQCGTVVKGKNPSYLRYHLMSRHKEVYNQHWDVNVSLQKRPNDSSTAEEWYWRQQVFA